MFQNLWERTKSVIFVYMITFIVLMFLNQLIFFGSCWSPYCLIAATPHISIITILLGSWINHLCGWGKNIVEGKSTSNKSMEVSQKSKSLPMETIHQDESEHSEPTVSQRAERVLGKVNSGLDGLNKKLVRVNVILSVKSKFFDEKSFVECWLEVAEKELEIQRELKADPALRKRYDELKANWDQDDGEKININKPDPEVREIASFILPAHFEDTENSEEIKEKIKKIISNHSKFLAETKSKLDSDPALMSIFEKNMEENGGSKIFAYIKAIQSDDSIIRKSGVICATNDSKEPQIDVDLPTTPIPKYAIKKRQRHVIILGSNQLSNKPKAIESYSKEINIPYLIHFTQAENLPSIMKHGLCSTSHMEKNDIEYLDNDQLRLDGHLNAVSISIAFPNYKMFYKYRKENPNHSWVVLVIDPSVMWRFDCAFYKLNAAKNLARKLSLDKLKTIDSLKSMFGEIDGQTSRIEQKLNPFETTDEQAEVMVFDVIKPSNIHAVIFNSEEDKDKYSKYLDNMEVEVHSNDDGFFSSRDYFKGKYIQNPIASIPTTLTTKDHSNGK